MLRATYYRRYLFVWDFQTPSLTGSVAVPELAPGLITCLI
jgi:hypothetical protein